MLRISISKRAEKDQSCLPAKHRRQIAVKLVQLRSTPVPPDSKKLIGYPYRRVDSGEYRIIYQIEGEVLQILRIGKRNDAEVYRHLP
jgi:mRNA interferase RelE/StbE